MNSFPPDLHFIYEWRNYQKRVLEELQEHLSNDHLHVVAAPGAGKTVLGLEVVRLLNKKTLVLTPTLTIRNQWIHHFAAVFESQDPDKQNLISSSLTDTAFLNVSTYQSLHAAKKNREQGISDLSGFKTLVLDEAHHLRNEWWKVLVELKQQLDGVKVIALTATPPYDVPPREWNRYFEMCGPIDSIISVPELVKEGNLCPHADFIYFSEPTKEEREKIRTFQQQLAELKEWLLASKDFSRALLGHPWISNFQAEANEEDILSEPEIFAALVIFLHHLGHETSAQKEFLGLTNEAIPQATDEWFEILLSAMISSESGRFDSTPGFRRELSQRLSMMHAVERRKVTLVDHKDIDKSLRNSESKLESILEIFELEQNSLGQNLRMVILTDYIRKEFLSPGTDGHKSRRLGAVPIFELIREKYGDTIPLALLTGSVIILPQSLIDEFFLALQNQDSDAQKPRAIPLLSDSAYVQMNLAQATRQLAVGAVTTLFNSGQLRTIVGTVALLGEGWDAPATNTLVMASASSTYVQTNQVRGRAIRVDPNDPAKISSVWHLACIESKSLGAGSDFQKIRNRFAAFEGLSYKGDQITSGFERLLPFPETWSSDQVIALNTMTCTLAVDRQKIAQGWHTALLPGTGARVTGLVEEVKAPSRSILALGIVKHPLHRSLVPATGLSGYLLTAMGASATFGVGFGQAVLYGAPFLAIFIYAARLPRLARDWWQVWRLGMGPVTLGRIAEVVLATLNETDMLDTPRKQLQLTYEPVSSSTSVCSLQGGSLYESDLFIRSMEETLDPVENPRYLIFRPHPNRKKAKAGNGDYHSIPSALNKKEHATVFFENWKKHLGPCQLIYTRRSEGRKMLLKARARAWASLDRKITNRQSVWK